MYIILINLYRALLLMNYCFVVSAFTFTTMTLLLFQDQTQMAVEKKEKRNSLFQHFINNNVETIFVQHLKEIIRRYLIHLEVERNLDEIVNIITFKVPYVIKTSDLYKVLEDESTIDEKLNRLFSAFPYNENRLKDIHNIHKIYRIFQTFCEELHAYKRDKYFNITLDELGLKEIYVINLKERPERLKNIQNIFKNDLNLNFTLFHAFYGKSMEKLLSQNKKIPNLSSESKMNYSLVKHEVKAFNETWNTVGCSQSHLHILFDIRDKAINGNDKPVLILEDDIEFHPKFKIKLKEVYKFIPDDWEILACGHCYTKWGFLSDTFETGNNYFNLVKVTDYLCTHGYIIRNANVAKKIISQLNVGNLVIVDVVIQQMVINKQLNVYAIVPELIRQNKEKYGSDISGDPVKEIVQNDEESELEL